MGIFLCDLSKKNLKSFETVGDDESGIKIITHIFRLYLKQF